MERTCKRPPSVPLKEGRKSRDLPQSLPRREERVETSLSPSQGGKKE